MLESLCNKVAGLYACKFIKKRLQQKYLSLNSVEFFRAAFFMEHIQWLLFKAMFDTCQNFTMKNEKDLYYVALASLMITWNMFTIG